MTTSSPRNVAYIRVSRIEQNPDNQIYELEAFLGKKYDDYYIDHGVSGAVPTKERLGFSRMLSEVDTNTVIHFTRVDRWGRGSGDTITAAEELLKKGIALNCLQIGQVLRGEEDKTTFNIHAVLAENELRSIRSRCKTALKRLKAEGTILGAPRKTSPEALKSILEDIKAGVEHSVIAKQYGISLKTVGRYKRMYLKDKSNTSLEEYSVLYNKQREQISKIVVANK